MNTGSTAPERPTREEPEGDSDGGDGMSGADAAPTRDDLPDVTDFSDYGGGGTDTDWGGGNSNEDDDFMPQQIAASSLRDHLLSQLATLKLPLRDRQIVGALIDAVDDDGYLTAPLEEIADSFSENDAIEPEELTIALKYLQSFDPAGVGARDPAECLTLQLKALPANTPFRAEALKVTNGHLPLLAARDYTKLKRALHMDEAGVRSVRDLIRTLHPHPGAAFAKDEANYVVPDVVVKKVRGQWAAALNEAAMPKLRLNRIYADILTRNRDSSNQQLSAQLQEAKWLIRNVAQRFETILRVAQAIVERQRRFFEHGEVAMRPMVLREIADMLSLHESTISRVTTQKYMLSPRGTFELKYFFGSHVATDTGGAASATAIRALIKQLIAAEDPTAPLTDSRIAELLGEQGIIVARRTIAKYREALTIPPVNLRKML
jgi:RNA polymerase sigma-54 factor